MTKPTKNVDLSAMQRVTDTLLAARKNNLKEVLEIAHRLEIVAEINEVLYINDSKATNIHATLYSMECMSRPLIWLVSVSDFKQDYDALYDLVRAKVKAIVCIQDKEVESDFDFSSYQKPISYAQDIEVAMDLLKGLVQNGDAVLFSPAHPSELRYDSFKERGDHFRKLVKSLTN